MAGVRRGGQGRKGQGHRFICLQVDPQEIGGEQGWFPEPQLPCEFSSTHRLRLAPLPQDNQLPLGVRTSSTGSWGVPDWGQQHKGREP